MGNYMFKNTHGTGLNNRHKKQPRTKKERLTANEINEADKYAKEQSEKIRSCDCNSGRMFCMCPKFDDAEMSKFEKAIEETADRDVIGERPIFADDSKAMKTYFEYKEHQGRSGKTAILIDDQIKNHWTHEEVEEAKKSIVNFVRILEEKGLKFGQGSLSAFHVEFIEKRIQNVEKEPKKGTQAKETIATKHACGCWMNLASGCYCSE